MFQARSIKHCKACGAPARYVVAPNDSCERATCTACGTIHYENPLSGTSLQTGVEVDTGCCVPI